MSFRYIFEWLSLFLLLGLGIYTLWVIKNERKIYLKNARPVHIGRFKFLIPSWWSETPTDSPAELSFKRVDAKYDWVAKFHWIVTEENLSIVELFKKQIADRKILFDEETTIICNTDFFKDKPHIKNGLFEMVHLEGTATQNEETRLYYDAYLIREIKSGAYLYAESKSSVLNGLVEGPYFEEVINRIEIL